MTTRFNFAPRSQAPAQSDDWKAQAFINLYLPNQDGKRTKLGAIPLKASKANEAKLMEWLAADPTRAEQLAKALIVEFRSAEPQAGSEFKLPV